MSFTVLFVAIDRWCVIKGQVMSFVVYYNYWFCSEKCLKFWTEKWQTIKETICNWYTPPSKLHFPMVYLYNLANPVWLFLYIIRPYLSLRSLLAVRTGSVMSFPIQTSWNQSCKYFTLCKEYATCHKDMKICNEALIKKAVYPSCTYYRGQ